MLYYTLLYSSIPYYTILQPSIPSIQYYTLLYSTILYYTLCNTILHHTTEVFSTILDYSSRAAWLVGSKAYCVTQTLSKPYQTIALLVTIYIK